MAELSERELEEMVGRHLAGRLDAQLGRASRGVMAEIARESRRERMVRLAWGAGALAAAAVVAVVVLPRGAGDAGEQARVAPAAAAEAGEPVGLAGDGMGSIERAVWSGVRDEGTVYLEDRPVRKLVMREVERVRWTDPSGQWRIEATVPVEDVMLVELARY